MKKTSLLLLCIFALVIGKTQSQNLDRPNIVWITSEDNSKHYLSLFDKNGVSTPHIEFLAKNGLKYTRAFSNAPVCSVARSTLISGCYAPRIGAQFHRTMEMVPMPGDLKMFPAYLREAGYYTTNNSKEDYNIIKSDDVWDESSRNATWKNREEGQPFFHVFNIGTTHESSLHFSESDFKTILPKNDMKKVEVQPNHPDSELFRYTNAFYRDKIQIMDQQVGEVIEELRQEGLLEHTIIFYFGDHGGVLPGSKGYLYETGLHIPLVVYIPEQYRDALNVKANSESEAFVSFIDFGPTVLHLAGIETPKQMDGKPFLGVSVKKRDLKKRNSTFSYADRFDEKYDMVRAVRIGKYKYIRSFQPFNFDGLMNNYRYQQLAYREWAEMYQSKKLNKEQKAFFESRPAELLYNVERDPYETNNLAGQKEYNNKLKKMRKALNKWMEDMPDLSLFPEQILISEKVIHNPGKFGNDNSKKIKAYLEIANFEIENFQDIEKQLEKTLKSNDPWKRYWAINVCSAFGYQALKFENLISEIAEHDKELINRVKAAEFLGLTKRASPKEVMLNALYSSENSAEALSILNSIVLMRDGPSKYVFKIDEEHLNSDVRSNDEVKRRLAYLDQ